MTGLFIIGGILTVGMILVVHGTIFKTRWGINASGRIECPRCGNVRGQIRAPRNFRQALWGGRTREQCGLEVDKWNRPVQG